MLQCSKAVGVKTAAVLATFIIRNYSNYLALRERSGAFINVGQNGVITAYLLPNRVALCESGTQCLLLEFGPESDSPL